MKKLMVLLTVLCSVWNVQAQCSMCKATAEQSDYASGINEGILYLMPLPAIIMAVFGVILYVNYKKKNV
jgi:heme/copper-type cytochrome/quinol oxidase subunit 2